MALPTPYGRNYWDGEVLPGEQLAGVCVGFSRHCVLFLDLSFAILSHLKRTSMITEFSRPRENLAGERFELLRRRQTSSVLLQLVGFGDFES